MERTRFGGREGRKGILIERETVFCLSPGMSSLEEDGKSEWQTDSDTEGKQQTDS